MRYSKNSILSDMKKAKGLGSAHHGAMHKLAHDITTIVNIPLILWVMYSIYTLRSATHGDFTAYFAHPFHAVMAILFVVVTLKHFALELQVVMEDYISCYFFRMVKILGMKIFFIVLGLSAIISILKVAL